MPFEQYLKPRLRADPVGVQQRSLVRLDRQFLREEVVCQGEVRFSNHDAAAEKEMSGPPRISARKIDIKCRRSPRQPW